MHASVTFAGRTPRHAHCASAVIGACSALMSATCSALLYCSPMKASVLKPPKPTTPITAAAAKRPSKPNAPRPSTAARIAANASTVTP